ncbi:hypothetical protein Vadar_026240 [Vaccinium darrowii]|uniref:Uncharacterized protein n=1 Tax=Vaccinium darrowii TaxID=229202 RepID=A0ACB7Y2P9_9ERIC|nr:hypothetical protein Vadar_026240 [Vaccinium darrowii]
MFEKVGPKELLQTTPLGEANMWVSIDVVKSKPYRLALGSINNIVAHGTTFWKSGPNEVLHTTPLGEGNLRVCIDVVKVSDAILPIPIPGEATTGGEAMGCHATSKDVEWEKNLETIELFAIVAENTSKEDATIIPLRKDIFGDEVEPHLQKVDMEYICQMKEVSRPCIMLYIRQLYKGIKASNMDRRFVFVNLCLFIGRMVAENLKPGLQRD